MELRRRSSQRTEKFQVAESACGPLRLLIDRLALSFEPLGVRFELFNLAVELGELLFVVRVGGHGARVSRQHCWTSRGRPGISNWGAKTAWKLFKMLKMIELALLGSVQGASQMYPRTSERLERALTRMAEIRNAIGQAGRGT